MYILLKVMCYHLHLNIYVDSNIIVLTLKCTICKNVFKKTFDNTTKKSDNIVNYNVEAAYVMIVNTFKKTKISICTFLNRN